jgi:hypothetical protein
MEFVQAELQSNMMSHSQLLTKLFVFIGGLCAYTNFNKYEQVLPHAKAQPTKINF